MVGALASNKSYISLGGQIQEEPETKEGEEREEREEETTGSGPAFEELGPELDASNNTTSSPDPPVLHTQSRSSGIPTKCPRLVTVHEISEDEQEDEPTGLQLEFDADEPETDGEVDESLLTRRDLAAAERLESEFALENLRRDRQLPASAMNVSRAHNFKTNVDLGLRAYSKLKLTFPQLENLPTLYQLKAKIEALSGVNQQSTTAAYRHVVALLAHTPISECAPYSMFSDKKMCEELEYRARFVVSPDSKITDVFDSLDYRHLRRRRVRVDDKMYVHKYFDQDTDIALGLSADGTRAPLSYGACAVLRRIPGPHEPKDMDSFLIPLRTELWKLAFGFAMIHALHERQFILRAFLIRAFGDMPAMAKLMRMKGPNGLRLFPCRACTIKGVRNIKSGSNTYYVPLRSSNGESYDPLHLPRRTHDQFIEQAVLVDTAKNDAQLKRRSMRTGINGLPILATLSSLSFPGSFGHDLRHLIPENVVKNLITLWTGDFKGLDTGNEDYQLAPTVIEAIGAAFVEASDTTPAGFGARVPNLNTQRHYCTAESYTLWTTLGPVPLRNRSNGCSSCD
ncbi:hypothetical protein MVEN_00044600 [Mycena venus]|uniref:Transposase family Tnp2 protein n=1 Tax=Mycena venus TaxID=2733690 RepID=A0A8H7DDW0_9AGAR|nr:hypothetical protein MVEN_00044600 [Mycena venus]